jgi:carbonic anhydrase
VERLKDLKPILEPHVKEGKLKILGAVYDLSTGVVTPLDTGKS